MGGAGCIAETPPGNCANAPSLHLLESGYDIRTVRELLGRKDVKTTMIYTHVLTRGPAAVRSPADALLAETDDTPVPSAAAAPLGRYPATARRLTLPGAGDD